MGFIGETPQVKSQEVGSEKAVAAHQYDDSPTPTGPEIPYKQRFDQVFGETYINPRGEVAEMILKQTKLWDATGGDIKNLDETKLKSLLAQADRVARHDPEVGAQIVTNFMAITRK